MDALWVFCTCTFNACIGTPHLHQLVLFSFSHSEQGYFVWVHRAAPGEKSTMGYFLCQVGPPFLSHTHFWARFFQPSFSHTPAPIILIALLFGPSRATDQLAPHLPTVGLTHWLGFLWVGTHSHFFVCVRRTGRLADRPANRFTSKPL